jgi:hypothetical protein
MSDAALDWSLDAAKTARAFGVPRITESRSYTFGFVAAFFRLRGRFRDFEAAPL